MALLSNMFIDMWILFYTTAAATGNLGPSVALPILVCLSAAFGVTSLLGLEVSWRAFLLNQEEPDPRWY